MKTEKLFVANVYLKEKELRLCDIRQSDCTELAFESTIFFPTGGGQLCDVGSINGHRVVDVKEEKESGIIWHKLEEKTDDFTIGESYLAQIDWDKRFSHMQMHCGEHLLSGAFLKLFGAHNKGFHMGDDYVTIDIDCPASEITKDMARKAEKLANEYVARDIPVETFFFAKAEEAMTLPCRKQIKFDNDISVVLIGDRNDPADCCACCGTHPSTTGQIGLIKITHSEKYKGMNRFYVKCGIKALDDYSLLQDIAEDLGKHYSCEAAGLLNAVKAEESRNEELYKKYSMLKNHCLKLAESEINAALASKEKITVLNYDYFTADDLQSLVRNIEITNLLVLSSEKEKCIILASDKDINCGQIIKDATSIYACRGGGKAQLARAVFENLGSLKEFTANLKNMIN